MQRSKLQKNLMLRWALPAAVLLIGGTSPAFAEVTVSPAAQGYDLDVEGEASVSELLDAISSATGATIKGQPADSTVAPNHLRGTSLERALRKLLPGAAFAVRYGGSDVPTEIIFLSPNAGDAAASDDGDSSAPDMSAPPIDGSD